MPNLPFKNCFLRPYSHRAAFPEQFHVQFSLSMPLVTAAQLPDQAVLIFRPLFIALPDLWDPLYSCGMPSVQLQVSSPGLCTKSLTPFTQLFYKNNYCVCGLYRAQLRFLIAYFLILLADCFRYAISCFSIPTIYHPHPLQVKPSQTKPKQISITTTTTTRIDRQQILNTYLLNNYGHKGAKNQW